MRPRRFGVGAGRSSRSIGGFQPVTQARLTDPEVLGDLSGRTALTGHDNDAATDPAG